MRNSAFSSPREAATRGAGQIGRKRRRRGRRQAECSSCSIATASSSTPRSIAAVVDAEHLAEVGFEITPEEVIRRFAGLTSVDIVEIIESEIGRPLAPGFLKEQKEELDRRLAAEVEGGPRRARTARPASTGRSASAPIPRASGSGLTMERTAALGPLQALHLLGRRGRHQEAEAGSERLPLRPGAVPLRPARCRRHRGFGLRRRPRRRAAGARVIGFTGASPRLAGPCRPPHRGRRRDGGQAVSPTSPRSPRPLRPGTASSPELQRASIL